MTKRPLVTQVVWSLERAGAERMVFDLARLLPSRGFDVEVVALGGGGEMETEFRAAGMLVQVVPAPIRASRWKLVRWLETYLAERKPAVWHTHLGADYWAGLAAAKKRVHPWVVTAHGKMADEPWHRRMARGIAYRRADAVVCVSDEVRNDALNRHHVPPANASVIRLGIDLARFPFGGRRAFRDVPRLAMVGRLVPDKNQATLLRGLADVRRPWTLELAGSGPTEHGLRLLAESLGIMPRVRFLGSISNVPELLASTDLFCFPSLHEGQSLALLEAAASGVPILASDLAVFRETFNETHLAFAEPTDESRWTAMIREILSRPHEAFARATAARRVVESVFSLDRMADAYAALYKRLTS